MRRLALTGSIALIVALAAPLCATGQVVLDSIERLDFDRPEAWAMKYFASLNLLTGFGPSPDLPAGAVVVAMEIDSVPSLSAAQQRVGFNGTKDEDLDRTSVFGRPRVTVGLPRGFAIEGSYLPPIDISGVEPDLAALALTRRLASRGRFDTGLRLTYQHGSFSGDFTCSAREIESGANAFGCEVPSNDEMTLDAATVEIALARRPSASGWRPHVALALTAMDLDFQVRADYRGLADRTRLVASGETYSVTAGISRDFDQRWRWTAEIFYSPLDVVRPPSPSATDDGLLNARLLLSYRAR